MLKKPSPNNVAFDEYDLIRSITRESFYDFVLEFWDTIIREPYTPNWHVKYLCDSVQAEMELVLARQRKRYDYIIINVPPVSLKSSLFMMFLNGWMWARNPALNFIGCSYEKDLAVTHSTLARDLIRSELYQAVFPEVRIRRDMAALGKFGNTAGGRRFSSGTQGNVTGKHGDVVVVDDPLNPRAARSEAESLAVRQFIMEALPTRKRLIAVSPTIIIMQRLAQDDPTGYLLGLAEKDSKVRIKHICLPATVSDLIHPPELRKFYDMQSGLLNPTRLDHETLASLRVDNEFMYAGQFDQNPIPAGGALFDVSKFKVGRPPSVTNPKCWVKQVRYWDKAASVPTRRNPTPCYTVGVRMGKDIDQNFWVLHVDRFRLEACTRERRIKDVATRDGKDVTQILEQEPGSSGKADAQATARNLAGYRVVLDRPTGDKEVRAEPYASQVNGGNVTLAAEGSLEEFPDHWHSPYINELRFFPAGKDKDQTDGSSGAFNHLVGGKVKFGFNVW